MVNSNTGVVHDSLKVRRYNKTIYVMAGDLNITADFNNDYDVSTNNQKLNIILC